MNIQLRDAFKKEEKALKSLEIIIVKPMQEDRSNVDASIQRFEFTIELLWKLLKRILVFEGIETTSPKHVLQEAYQTKLIDDEQLWLNMLTDRNLTSHTYDEELADEIYSRIKKYCPLLRKTFNALKQKYGAVNQ
jgi:nucleotidyltransferase substrate binding protein (TIGR01987 family)